ncbi:hypothetical protein EV424DRAFT_1469489 [Suillus variegatus]|nr:hypothetical protein EV424DRAFT_1469489 [Suillus variegatus]
MVFALCNYPALLTSGILRLDELQDSLIEDYPADIRREHRVFLELLDFYPGLLDCLTGGEEEDIIHIGELLGKGVSGARGDDTKTLKSAVLKRLVPRGQVVIPPLSRNIKTKEGLKSGETTVRGDQWPIFLYAGHVYDPKDPWKGLLRSDILIFGFKHVFMSPSSVDKKPKATRSSNVYLHGMKSVTKGSLAYIATQVQFSLSSSSVFFRTDMITDSENFYHSILDLLEDTDESEEVGNLMLWWTRFIMHSIHLKLQTNTLYSHSQHCISKNSALLKIRENTAALQE